MARPPLSASAGRERARLIHRAGFDIEISRAGFGIETTF